MSMPSRASAGAVAAGWADAAASAPAWRERFAAAIARESEERRFFLWIPIAAVGGVIWVGAHLPSISSLEIPKRPPTIQIVGTDGSVIATRGEMPGANVSLKDLPPYLPNAFIAIEDRRFYSHFGIDPIGIVRAAIANVLHRGVSQGGSTLTQQLAKNLFLTQERTLQRKLQEAELALWLERKYSKKTILELYLNRVYFGSGAYGVEAAAQKYFGKPAKDVTLFEAAMLAGLVKSPSRLAPNRNPEGAEKRADTVLAAMVGVVGATDEVQGGVGNILEGGVLVGDDQRVVAGGVGEEVEPAFFLDQPRGELQVAFVELNGIVAGAAGWRTREGGQACILEHLL